MKQRAFPLLCAIALTWSAVTGQAQLGMIGDTVSVDHYYPDLSTVWGSGGTVVVPGTAIVYPALPHYVVDIQDTSVSVDFVLGAGWIVAPFDGLVVGQIDGTLTAVVVDTNLAGWDDANLAFDAHALYANWSGLGFDSSSYFNMELTFAPIPEPSVLHASTTFAALGLAMLGLSRARGRE